MNPSGIEYELIKRHGNLHAVIPALATELGQEGAARKLSCDGLYIRQAWVSRWLRNNGYEPVTRYEKLERA